MEERSLCMWEAPGSIPGFSKYFSAGRPSRLSPNITVVLLEHI